MSITYFNLIFEIGIALLIILLLILILRNMRKNRNIHIKDASLTQEVLEEHARTAAQEHSISSKTNAINWPMTRMNENYNAILSVCKGLNEDVIQKRMVPPAAEWLLDNFYIVEEQVKIIRRDLNKKEYHNLPVLARGPFKGYTRIFAIAIELVSHTDGQIEVNTLLKYLEAYQSHSVLLEREISILPIMIKLALIENIRTISEKIKETKEQWNLADEIVEKWMEEGSADIERIMKLLKNKAAKIDGVNPSLLEHLFYRLRRTGRGYSDVLKFIDENLDQYHTTAEIVTQKEHSVQAVYTVSMGNCIATLKYISSIDWSEIFKTISFLENILRQDPDGTYQQMDINSGNYYKSQIGLLSKKYQVSELHIAREAIALAKEASLLKPADDADDDENGYCMRSHVGYYIVGNGLKILESRQKGQKTFFAKLKSAVAKKLGILYLGFIGILTLCIILLTMGYVMTFPGENGLYLVLLSGLAVAIPASEVAVSIANWLVCKVKKPAFFPRLELKDGVPESMCTMVVIPALLSDEKRVEQLLENIENHYLANREDHLYFALIGAFADAKEQSTNKDTNVLLAASQGIKALNLKYAKDGKDIFYFYNRLRKFNESDNNWTGWERKRGALMEFNEMLLGSQETSFIFYSNVKIPTDKIKYIITLDADTILPFGMAKKMIGTMAHPLNIPVIDQDRGIVTEGYGIMQPKISFDLESANKSIFSRIYTGQEGIDPYASAISDVYQDLFGEGIFTGKGIYELKAFHQVLKDAIPENTVLSHDLLEGSYARTALVTDLELVDSYPTKYNSYMARLHRWIRGDWQLIPWLRRRINNGKKEPIKNPLSYLSIWKIMDNLRRSLIAPAFILFMLLGCSILPGSSIFWLGLSVAGLALPFVLTILGQIIRGLKFGRIKHYLSRFFGIKASLFQFLLCFVFLPYQAMVTMHAVIVTLFRVIISKQNMLEWVTSADVEKTQSGTLRSYLSAMGTSMIIGFIMAIFSYFFKPEGFLISLVFLIVWCAAPFIAYYISKEDNLEKQDLNESDLLELRKITRKTWRYFEEFSNAKNNYLAPDNFQEDPPRGIACRTSPTNIGLGLLAVLSARDMGYMGIKEAISFISKTVTTIEKMEKWNGHLYNWYDTRTLEPLKPLYVSTVDSGNFVCYLITLAEGLKTYYSKPLIDASFARGINDTLRNGLEDGEEIPADFNVFDFMDKDEKIDLMAWNKALGQILEGDGLSSIKKPIWKARMERMIKMLQEELGEFIPWAAMAEEVPKELLHDRLAEETSQLLNMLKQNVSLTDILEVNKKIIRQIDKITKCSVNVKGESLEEGFDWLNQLIKAVLRSNQFTLGFIHEYKQIIERIENLSGDISFKPLYNEGRQLFSIGYNVDEKKLTNSYYDLLASEARQASYIAIARGEVPPKHWFMLGRSLTVVDHYKGLVSWSGTMFEYLMPLLIMKSHRNTLLDETYSFVIKSQQKYGKVRGMPWGASESAFSSMDINLDYQYKAIGVPWLGLKRGLIEDAVTSPYSTFLALMVSPVEAFQNLQHLKAEGLEGPYGYYEAADYTPERTSLQSRKVIIKSFMAHHQGMSLLALNNCLNKNIMQKRFFSDPSVKAARLLLQEKIPVNILFTKDNKEKIVTSKAKIYRDRGAYRRFTAPDEYLPKTHVLSNGNYSVMVTDKGTGYSKSKIADLSRWRDDSVHDSYGMFYYIKNMDTNQNWSAAYAPLNVLPEKYEAVFTPDKAAFKRVDGEIETMMEIIVTSDDNAEVRQVKLKNNGDTSCVIEITSYFEIVLASRNSDLAHPVFNNLFVRTEFNEEYQALLANRRPRSPEDKEMWAAEIPVIDGELVDDLQYETDRMQFIGRGRTVHHPVTVEREKPLTNSVGPVLDPIFSFRIKVKIEPDEEARISFVTVTAHSRERIMELIDKYSSMEACDAAFWLALTRSQVETKYLNIKAPEMELYQDMVSNILFISSQKLKYQHLFKDNKKGQASLWAYGISGDRPIILVILDKTEEAEILYEVLRAHEYWRLKDLNVDLVILCNEENSYSNPLYALITDIVYSGQAYDALHRHNDIFIIQTNKMMPEDLDLFYAAARMVFKGSGGTMKEQMQGEYHKESLALLGNKEKLSGSMKYQDAVQKVRKEKLSSVDHAIEEQSENYRLQYFNGLGGFDCNGKEYVITLEKGQMTPAPWINVIANSDFGFLVSEAGGGYTWCENSRENKLTPWSNDPVSDHPGEVFYLNEEMGDPWTITPLPIREEEEYTIRHGFGYSEFQHESHELLQSLVQFVPVNGKVKVSIISLTNRSSEDRTLTITYYLKPVLGVNTRDTAMHLVSSQNAEGTLIIKNPYNREFADQICFVDSSIKERSVTGDRRAFFGNGNTDFPDSLKQKGLSGALGAGYDSCAAMQVRISIKAKETKEFVFLLGMAENQEKVDDLITAFNTVHKAKEALNEVKSFWKEKLETIQVNTPDAAMNLMLNGWLLYQTISCRLWARSGFYQAGGAFGFRDQLQDCLSVAAIWPDLAKKQILKHAQHQFIEGDVLHWWHEPAGKGPRTRISDDYLWLPYVTAEYVRITGDYEILKTGIPFLEGDPLKDYEDERYFQPRIASEGSSLFDHCIRAIEKGLEFGERGLPLMGGGDWNDGMNTVGNCGKGESVWLGWFLCSVLQKFIPLCRVMGDDARAEKYLEVSDRIVKAIEENGWDGNWYRRAYFDNGIPLGSAVNRECKIDSLAQSWSVISGKGDKARAVKAMNALEDYLVMREEGLIRLLTPPFNDGDLEPGYIKGYVPGVRENGGQYTHAAAWVVAAFAMMGDGDKAYELFGLINPINHTRTNREYSIYKVEPYVMSADVYSVYPHIGRGGWTWYTGSASWMYKAGLENILGFNKYADQLVIDPCIPKKWTEYSITYRYIETTYQIIVKNPKNSCKGVSHISLDGEIQSGNSIKLTNDKTTHQIEVLLG